MQSYYPTSNSPLFGNGGSGNGFNPPMTNNNIPYSSSIQSIQSLPNQPNPPMLVENKQSGFGSHSIASTNSPNYNNFNNSTISNSTLPSQPSWPYQQNQPTQQYNSQQQYPNYVPKKPTSSFASPPAPQVIMDHLEESLKFLQALGYDRLELSGSYSSYMTGLQYHSFTKPETQKIYMCKSDPENQYDSNAIGVYNQNNRLAYVPKLMAKFISEKIQNLMSTGEVQTCLLVAVCTGKCSEKSVQCIYNLYVNFKPFMQE